MIRELGSTSRDGLLLSTVCNESHARAMIGATTSRLVGFWLIQACDVATVPFPHLFGQRADSLNYTAVILQARRATVNVGKNVCGVGHIPGTAHQRVTKRCYSRAGAIPLNRRR
jgi:hypothetical protein